jgi:hypothetical protein
MRTLILQTIGFILFCVIAYHLMGRAFDAFFDDVDRHNEAIMRNNVTVQPPANY